MHFSKKKLEDIDPLIRGLVFFLNQKEKATIFSCEGHAPDYNMYLVFREKFFLANKDKLDLVAERFKKNREYTFQEVKFDIYSKRMTFCLLGSEEHLESEIKKIEEIFKEVFNV